jgi:hypothetical protein
MPQKTLTQDVDPTPVVDLPASTPTDEELLAQFEAEAEIAAAAAATITAKVNALKSKRARAILHDAILELLDVTFADATLVADADLKIAIAKGLNDLIPTTIVAGSYNKKVNAGDALPGVIETAKKLCFEAGNTGLSYAEFIPLMAAARPDKNVDSMMVTVRANVSSAKGYTKTAEGRFVDPAFAS